MESVCELDNSPSSQSHKGQAKEELDCKSRCKSIGKMYPRGNVTQLKRRRKERRCHVTIMVEE